MWFISLLQLFKRKQKSERLAKTAANAVSVFQTTITKLREVVEAANQSMDKNKKSIEKLETENANLTRVIEENTNMAAKLSDLFNPSAPSSSSDGQQQ